MNREDFILSASAPQATYTSQFTRAVMHKINTPEKQTLFSRVRHLHGPALAAAIIVAVLAVSGVAYAATVLWHIVNEGVNESGRQEYSVQGATSCISGSKGLNRFEIKRDAPKLSDEESKKIIRAACELGLGNQFASNLQPKYELKQRPKPGDTMKYVSAGIVGTATKATDTSLSVEAYGITTDYEGLDGKEYKVYDAELKEVNQPVKVGDAVRPIVLEFVQYTEGNTRSNDRPDQRVIGAMRLSLPIEYYTTYQSYVTEVPPCTGNETESCPNTASLDVFPRGNGEGSKNEQLDIADGEDMKQISGVVSNLSADTITLKARSGTEYTFTVSKNGFDAYNAKYAPEYTDFDARLVLGSSVMVMYFESAGEHSKHIGPTKIASVTLLLEGKNPKQSVKPY